MTLFYL